MKKVDDNGFVAKEVIRKDYERLVKKAEIFAKRRQWSRCCGVVATAAELMYHYSFIFTDARLESVVEQIGGSLREQPPTARRQGTVAFCDYFAIDGRGLSLIYVKALLDLGYKVIFITASKNREMMPRIEKLLNNSGNGTIRWLVQRDSYAQAQEIYDILCASGAEKLLMHTSPWDVPLLAAAARAGTHGITRYMINITDHAFWVGIKALDYSLEFRNMGYSLSAQYRGIETAKLRLLPYYPASTEQPFQGFPFDLTGKKLVFSGGAFYKTSGSPIYWDTVRYILDGHPDVVFLYAGSGDGTEMRQFVQEHQYESRFYIIEERKDLDEIMKRCTFYLSTYPLAGGLMAQYAAANGKVPVTYRDEGIESIQDIDGIFLKTEDSEVGSFVSLDRMWNEIDHLLTDESYCKMMGEKWKTRLLSAEQFKDAVGNILQEGGTPIKTEVETSDPTCYTKYFLTGKQNLPDNYALIFWRRHSVTSVLTCLPSAAKALPHIIGKIIKR